MKKFSIFFTALLLLGHFAKAQFGGKPVYEILAVQGTDTFGIITVELYPTIAPLHVANFDSIVKAPVSFDNRAFHRVIPNFMIQGGDPNSISGPESTWGTGDPDQANVDAEFSPLKHYRGVVSAARSENINSASSQFFICVADYFSLDNRYTIYGKTIKGMPVADTIVTRPVVDAGEVDRPVDKIEMFIDYISTDSTVPSSAPESLLPISGTEDVFSSTQFTWNKVDTNDFLLYKLQFSQDSTFQTVEQETNIDSALSSWYVNDLEQGFKLYYWRVCANNGGNLSCSPSKTLTTYLASPTLVFPTNDLEPATTLPTFTWNSVDQADQYHIQVSRNENFNISLQRVVDTIVTDTSFYWKDTLGTSTRYYWHVAPIKNLVEGSYSETWNFRTTEFTGITEPDLFNKLALYPNPTQGQLYLDFIMLKGNYKVEVIDLRGRIISEQTYNAAQGKVLLDLSDELAGIYYLQVREANSNKIMGASKVVLQPSWK